MRDIDRPIPCACRGSAPCEDTPPRCGYLMQQIVAAGRVWLRYEPFSLCLSGLPCGAAEPLTLTAVCADGCVTAERCCAPCGRGLSLRLCIPLRCEVCGADGCRYAAESRIEAQVPLRVCNPCGTDRAQAAASAFVRLARGCCPVRDGAADARLDVCAEAWLTACRPVYTGACPPPCPPQLPLYPQPCRMRPADF